LDTALDKLTLLSIIQICIDNLRQLVVARRSEQRLAVDQKGRGGPEPALEPIQQGGVGLRLVLPRIQAGIELACLQADLDRVLLEVVD